MAHEYDYHLLMLSPGLPAAWLFQAARRYWMRFQPVVTDDWSLIDRIPAGASVAVTVLAHPDTLALTRQLISARRQDISFDVIVVAGLPEMEILLDGRASEGNPVGRPQED